MSITNQPAPRRWSLLCSSVLCFLWAASSAAEEPAVPAAIDVAVGNSSNSRLFWADFVDTDSAIQLSTDANESSGLGSLAFFSNICGAPRLDLVAANTNGGDLLYYAGGTDRWQLSTSMCAGGNCPERPAGLSASNAHQSLSGIAAQRVVAAETGAAGKVPELWFFMPDCNDSGQPLKSGGVPGGGFTVEGYGPVGAIADTEFVRVAGGGLGVGDLLVTVADPNLIARVPAAAIDALIDNGTQLPAAEVLIPPAFFGSDAPTGLTLVPGTSNADRNESLLVTVPPARVLKLNIGEPITTLPQQIFFAEELGNGPLGIAAGTRGDRHFMVIADRQRGRTVQVRLFVDPDTGAELCDDVTCPTEIKAIKDDLQFPLGVAFNSNATIAGNCTGLEGGCQLGSAMQLFLPELSNDNIENNSDSLIIAELVFVLDDRGDNDTTLALPPGFGGDFRLPSSCRGFEVDGWPQPVVPIVNLTTDVDIGAGAVVNLQEVLSGILPQVADCTTSGARIYHHRLPDDPVTGAWNPDAPEQGTLLDATVFCSNPSRGMNDGIFSPFAVCSDAFFKPHADLTNEERRAARDEVLGRIGNLEIVVQELLFGHAGFDDLRQGLEDAIADARWVLRRPSAKQEDFLAASGIFENGASQVLSSKTLLPWETLPNSNAYGNLLLRLLALAFFNSETAAQTPFCPNPDLQAEIGIACP
ncbi:MAG: hypothetical protein RQ847_11005 [Wenzhouxiangellaceae bacterium]|nr:hypothetical protein [Wenzhouxiangellaceae bacterium]